MYKSTQAIFGKSTLLEKLSNPARDYILSKAYAQEHTRRTTICLQGDATNTLKLVVSGWVKLYRVTSCGKEAILETLTAGQSFDEIAALEAGYSSSSAETLSNCLLMYIDLSMIFRCENAYMELSRAILLATSERLEEMSRQVEQLKVKTATQRLSSFLIEHSNRETAAGEVTLPYDKLVLAGILGMKPESLSRALNRLKRLGVSCQDRVIRIDDVSKLKAFSSEDTTRQYAAL